MQNIRTRLATKIDYMVFVKSEAQQMILFHV